MSDLRRATVWWADAHGGPEERVSADGLAGLHKPIMLATTGWVLRDDDVGVSLAFERFCSEDERNDGLAAYDWRGIHFVTRAMIDHVDYLAEVLA